MPPIFKRLFSEHPTLIVTVSYLQITIIGVIYSYFFYQNFELNILKFSDLSDFLLVSILEPRSILVFLTIVVVMAIMIMGDYYLRRRFKTYGDFVNSKLKPKYSDPFACVLLVTIFTPFSLSNLAYYNAKDIKNGNGDVYEVRLSDAGQHSATQSLVLLGTSSRYGYFYQVDEQSTFTVPVENISYMRKVSGL